MKNISPDGDDIDELPDQFFENAVYGFEGLASLAGESSVSSLRRSGRPRGRTKRVVSLSLDLDLVEALHATGKGWQTRANAALRQYLGLSQRV